MHHGGGPGRLAARLLTVAALIAAAGLSPAVAQALPVSPMPAMTPPTAGGAPPSADPIAPLVPTRQAQVCAKMVASKPDFISPPAGFASLDIEKAWQFSRGAGQKIAVIDTGVFRSPGCR